MQGNSARFTTGTFLNFLGFITNYPVCRPAACKKFQQFQLGRKLQNLNICRQCNLFEKKTTKCAVCPSKRNQIFVLGKAPKWSSSSDFSQGSLNSLLQFRNNFQDFEKITSTNDHSIQHQIIQPPKMSSHREILHFFSVHKKLRSIENFNCCPFHTFLLLFIAI